MRKMLNQTVALLLCAMLFASCGACSAVFPSPDEPAPEATAAPVHSPVPIVADDHASVRFSDMQYSRPDTEALRESIQSLERRIAAQEDAHTLLDAYHDVYAQFGKAESAMSLAYLLYAFDVTEPYYEQEYSFLQSELNAIDLLMTDVSVRLFESSEEVRQLAQNAYGEKFILTVYEEESLNSEEIQSLQDEELALVNTFNRVSNEFTFVDDNGESHTYDDLIEMAESEEFEHLYEAYTDQLNRAAGEIYVSLTNIRAEIARKLGYGSYAAYMYDCYGRDYTLEDAKRLQAAVKTHIVPVYLSAYGLSVEETYAAADEANTGKQSLLTKLRAIRDIVSYFLSGKEKTEAGVYNLSVASFSQETFFAALRNAAMDFSPNLYASLNYMLTNDLYNFSVDPKKMTGSFTTYISEYDAPFIFSQWENDSYSVNTVIHELGHYTNYYRNPFVGWSAGDSLDLAEVDSQGLELLMIPYYERFFGDLAPYAEHELLVNCMYALISGCMEDEFQQAVYANPGMTLAEMNDVYKRLAVEYGFDTLYGYTGKEWVEIPHTFQSPMYYISYAVSMVPALELFKQSQTDADAAKAAYFRIVDREPYAAFGDVIRENGLPNVFSEDTIRGLAELLRERIH